MTSAGISLPSNVAIGVPGALSAGQWAQAAGRKVNLDALHLRCTQMADELAGIEALATDAEISVNALGAELRPLVLADSQRKNTEEEERLRHELNIADLELSQASKLLTVVQEARGKAWQRPHDFQVELQSRPQVDLQRPMTGKIA